MTTENKFSIFIDTKLDKNQNPSNFKIRLNDWFLRNKFRILIKELLIGLSQ